MNNYQAAYNWKINFQVAANASQDQISQQVTALMTAHAKSSFQNTIAKKGYNDATITNIQIQVQNIGSITSKVVATYSLFGIPMFLGLINHTIYQCTVQGATIVDFSDQSIEALAITAGVAACFTVALIFAPETLIVLGPVLTEILLGVLAVSLLAAVVIDVESGTAQALQTAVSTPAGAVVTIIAIVAVAILVVGIAWKYLFGRRK